MLNRAVYGAHDQPQPRRTRMCENHRLMERIVAEEGRLPWHWHDHVLWYTPWPRSKSDRRAARSSPVDPSQACAFAGTMALVRWPGSAIPAAAPRNDSPAETPIAGLNPSMNACAEPKLPTLANTAARMASPNAAPSWRSMLNAPEALPISFASTELTTAFWPAGMAAAPKPAIISGTMTSGSARPGLAISPIQAIAVAGSSCDDFRAAPTGVVPAYQRPHHPESRRCDQ